MQGHFGNDSKALERCLQDCRVTFVMLQGTLAMPAGHFSDACRALMSDTCKHFDDRRLPYVVRLARYLVILAKHCKEVSGAL